MLAHGLPQVCQQCAHDLLTCQSPVRQHLMALQAVCQRSANSLPMPRPISASGLGAVCLLCAHGRPMTYAWFCKMSAGPPMARPRSASELSVACLWSAQHPLVACARSAHDVPLVNQRHAHGFANGRPMLCQVCMPVVSCQSASGLWLSSGRLTGQTYARAIGQTTVLADL